MAILDKLTASIENDFFLSDQEFNQAMPPEGTRLSRRQTFELSKFLIEAEKQSTWSFGPEVIRQLKTLGDLDQELVQKLETRSTLALRLFDELKYSTEDDSVLGEFDWEVSYYDLTQNFDDGGRAGLFLYLDFLQQSDEAYELEDYVFREIFKILGRGDDVGIKLLAAARGGEQDQVEPEPSEVLDLLTKYFPGIVRGGSSGCARHRRYDFNRDRNCTELKEGRLDYNNDGVIDSRDDWILLELNRHQLGGNSPALVKEAKKYWKAQVLAGYREAQRHLDYWSGSRSLRFDNFRVGVIHGTTWVDSPDEVGVRVSSPIIMFESANLYILQHETQVGSSLGHRLMHADDEVIVAFPKVSEFSRYALRFSGLERRAKVDTLHTGTFIGEVWKPIFLSDLDVDVPNHSITFGHNQHLPIDNFEVTFWSENSAFIAGDEKNPRSSSGLMHREWFRIPASDQDDAEVTLTWNEKKVAEDEVKEVKVVAHDPRNDGYTHTWWIPVAPISIPHEEVLFQFGSEEPVDADQMTMKLMPSIQKVWQMSAYYPRHTFKLWVVGYTDRVGSESYNQKLSRKRARAIAKYFHEYLSLEAVGSEERPTIEVFYTGVGESRAETEDEVKSPKDRKVDYLMSHKAPFAADWQLVGD